MIPGIFAQTVLFNSAFTGVGVADDLSKGIIDRLRSLPMYPSAVLIGRTLSDIVRNVLTFAVMLARGVPRRVPVRGQPVGGARQQPAADVPFSYAFSWIQALIGLSVGSVEAANSAGFIWMFPLTFVSSAFVDRRARCRLAAADRRRNNPFTNLTNACRALYNGYDPGNDLWIAIAWAVGITVVFAILATRKFARSTSA